MAKYTGAVMKRIQEANECGYGRTSCYICQPDSGTSLHQKICDKHHTNLKFVIGPDYYQKKASREDIKILKAILGDSAVWDFTGINEYTADIHHYYEPGHYRPLLGARLLKAIYQDQDTCHRQ